jgi:hypothetical protein
MSQRTVKNKIGQLIARLDEGSGKLYISNAIGQRLGYYDTNTDSTHNKIGQRIGSGDQRMTLL